MCPFRRPKDLRASGRRSASHRLVAKAAASHRTRAHGCAACDRCRPRPDRVIRARYRQREQRRYFDLLNRPRLCRGGRKLVSASVCNVPPAIRQPQYVARRTPWRRLSSRSGRILWYSSKLYQRLNAAVSANSRMTMRFGSGPHIHRPHQRLAQRCRRRSFAQGVLAEPSSVQVPEDLALRPRSQLAKVSLRVPGLPTASNGVIFAYSESN